MAVFATIPTKSQPLLLEHWRGSSRQSFDRNKITHLRVCHVPRTPSALLFLHAILVCLVRPLGFWTVILGPSGSGKSTLMNIIGGIDRADSGSILVDGAEITGFSDVQLAQ